MSEFDEFMKQTKRIEAPRPAQQREDIHEEIDAALGIKQSRPSREPQQEQPEEKRHSSYFDKVHDKMDQQKKIKIKFKRTEPDPEKDISDDDRKRITENFITEKKLNKKEARRMRRGEKSPVMDLQRFFISFIALALFALVMMWSYAPKNDVIMIIVTIIGSALFMPIGMVLGWMFLDPYMRCKIARKITRKNFGIVNFVGKPNRATSRLKNFDDDLIWIKTKCWAISNQGIYEVDKNGERSTEGHALDPDSFILVTETVPIMFVDINSMTPLRLEGDQREKVSPEEIASILKGWIDAQMAKLMFMKKTMNILLVIAICAAAAAAYFGYMNNAANTDLTTMVKNLQTQMATMSERLAALMPEAPAIP